MVSTASRRVVGILLVTLFLFHLPAAQVSSQIDDVGHEHYVNSVEWNNEGNILASGSTDQSIRLWNEDGSFLAIKQSTVGPNASVLDLAWGTNDTKLVSGQVDNIVLGWNGTDDSISPVNIFDNHGGFVKAVDVLPGSDEQNPIVISGGDDTAVFMYELDSSLESGYRQVTAIRDHGNTERITDVKFDSDGDIFATASSDGVLRVYSYNANTEAALRVAQTDLDSTIFALDVNDAGDRFLAVTQDGISSFERSSSLLTQVGSDIALDCGVEEDPCLNAGVEFSPDEDMVAFALDTKVEVFAWNEDTGLASSADFSLDVAEDLGFNDGIKAVDVSWNPDNTQLGFAVGADVYNYDVSTGEQIFAIEGDIPQPNNIVFIVGAIVFLGIIVVIIVRRQLNKESM